MKMTESAWVDAQTWEAVQQAVPILCVDLLPTRLAADSEWQIGLIKRQTPFGRPMWCQIGGRVLHGETLREALVRHLETTLSDVPSGFSSDPQPDYVMQWFPTEQKPGDPGPRFGLDPRKHAVALSFLMQIEGEPVPVAGGEALEFSWFPLASFSEGERELWPGTEWLIRALTRNLAAQTG